LNLKQVLDLVEAVEVDQLSSCAVDDRDHREVFVLAQVDPGHIGVTLDRLLLQDRARGFFEEPEDRAAVIEDRCFVFLLKYPLRKITTRTLDLTRLDEGIGQRW